MKSYNIVFKNNKFYEAEAGKRVFPKDGGIFLIASDSECFEDNDPLNLPHQPQSILNTAEKLQELLDLENLKSYSLFLPANTHLFFKVSLSKKKNTQEAMHYEFRLTLLEDLYLYYSTTWKDNSFAESFNCKCIVDVDVLGNVGFFEPIYANSINEAYSKTRQFYFANQGTAGASAYKVMKLENNMALEDCRNLISKNDFIEPKKYY